VEGVGGARVEGVSDMEVDRTLTSNCDIYTSEALTISITRVKLH